MTLIKRTSRAGKSAAAFALCAVMVSCSSDSGSGGNGGDSGLRGEVLASLGQNVIVPLQERFAARAAALETALVQATPEPGGRDAAQEAWRQAMQPWQELEMMQLGPSGSSLTVMGGQDLRARIYSWPNLNLCLVDQQTVEEGYDDPDALQAVVGGPLGLWAIEYLLFNESAANNCSPLNTINQDGIWDAMADMTPQRRLDYAAALSTLVRRRADDLVAAWAPSGGNYIAELTDPGRSGAVYGTVQEGLNAVSDAMFYLDKETKDMKLGEPLGIINCATATCPESIESQWATRSKQHVVANLRAFQALFLGSSPGTDALGFDDLLIDMGAPDVAADMAQAIADAIAATEAISGTFFEALEQDPTQMEAAHSAIRQITDLLKTDLLSILDLEQPDRAAGDND
ncbi:MAG: hypothetical protein AMJ62_02165 [Myxococcales bacterium SG8_38]|nr:MAG: hypothetical protein AMJ62_02165 [Myxococcales bacterium SG8_38]